MEVTKKCSKCGETKPTSAFHKAADKPLGRASACKVCRGVAGKLKYAANADGLRAKSRDAYAAAPERKLAKNRAHYAANKERYCAAGRQLYARNKQARRLSIRAWAAAHPEQRREASRALRKASPEKGRLASRKYRGAHPDRSQASTRAWSKANRDKCNAMTAARKARKLQATPAWADKAIIDATYTMARAMTDLTKVKHHVDHTVPLRSKLVCGLHTDANLRIIPATENCSKGNRTWENMPA